MQFAFCFPLGFYFWLARKNAFPYGLLQWFFRLDDQILNTIECYSPIACIALRGHLEIYDRFIWNGDFSFAIGTTNSKGAFQVVPSLPSNYDKQYLINAQKQINQTNKRGKIFTCSVYNGCIGKVLKLEWFFSASFENSHDFITVNGHRRTTKKC